MINARRMLPILQRLKPVLPVLLMTVILAGCATNPGPAARSLPPPPGRLMHPVPVPALYKGQDARAALRLTGTALIEANARLSASAGWYESVRRSYGQ